MGSFPKLPYSFFHENYIFHKCYPTFTTLPIIILISTKKEKRKAPVPLAYTSYFTICIGRDDFSRQIIVQNRKTMLQSKNLSMFFIAKFQYSMYIESISFCKFLA